MADMTRALPLLCSLLGIGCVAPFPPLPATGEATDVGSASTGLGPTTDAQDDVPGTTSTADTTQGESTTGSVDTSVGTTTTDGDPTDPSTSGSSSDGPAVCLGQQDCGNNEVCDNGSCVPACNPWGPSNYGNCLDAYGGFDPMGCGANYLCVYHGVPIQATTCAEQGCTSACDCPGPAATGDATVSCADITNDGMGDCYLSCANGETCPDGTVCLTGAVESFCMTPPAELPSYGNCGNVDAPCIAGAECVQENGYSACIDVCMNAGRCDPAPPGALNPVACDSVFYPPLGLDCHVPCTIDGDCPSGMECYTTTSDVQLCMWPPL